MGLLDSDAEELKRNKTGEVSSGRKVNQSGLGALRGLSKYSNLTAKYRTTGKAETSEAPENSQAVEQSRGTLEKSVQSPGKVSADIEIVQPSATAVEVSANSVQSQCSDDSASAPSVVVEVSAKSVQSGCDEVSQVNIVSNEEILKASVFEKNEVSAKSVQNEENGSDFVSTEIRKDEATVDNTMSVQSQCVDSKCDQTEINHTIVSAKSVQAPDHDVLAETLSSAETVLVQKNAHIEDFESQCKVSANEVFAETVSYAEDLKYSTNVEIPKSVQSECKVSAEDIAELPNFPETQVSAKSVQSRGKQRSSSAVKEKSIAPLKSVQSQCEVGANDIMGASDRLEVEVSAKSVQSRGEVRARKSEEVESIGPTKTKVIVRDLELLEPTESIISISGSQRVIVDFLFQLCLWNNSLVTPPITKQQLTTETGLLEETALSSVKRLRKKNIIERYAYKDGKAGWTQYQFSETSYKELLHLRQVGAKSVQQQPLPTLDARTMSPSVGIKKGTSGTLGPKSFTADQGWFKNLDFTKIHPINAMMVNAAIRAQVEEKLTPELVQDFINRFTSWTSTQGRITSPIGLFCDKLKELAKEGDSPIFSFMTEEERQVEAVFAAQVEKAKLEMELIRKARIQSAEKETEAAFEQWFASSTDAEKLQMAEPGAFAPAGSEAYKRILRAAYFESIQPKA